MARGSRVRLRPSRRADAQDIFLAGRTRGSTSVHEDVDGNTHVGVVIEDDPAADLHDWYGRYLYFAPDEVEPLDVTNVSPERSSTWKSWLDRHGCVAIVVVAGVVIGVRSIPGCAALPEDAAHVVGRRHDRYAFWSPVSATSSSATTGSDPR